MRVGLAAAAWVVVAGCYSPSLAPCELRCDGQQCPDGLACNAQGLCAASASATCSAVTDAGEDACPWRPSNVDPCSVGALMRTGPSVLGELTIDTGATPPPLDNAELVITSQRTLPSLEVAVLIAGDLTVNGRVTVRGRRPLVILADSVQIDPNAGFEVEPADVPCPAGEGAPGQDANAMSTAGGGGGGGFGAVGAAGGLGGAQPPPAARGGIAVGTEELVPLRGGCRGGQGGTLSPNLGAGGGLGGGAIQISARRSMLIAGSVAAPGRGGSAPTTSDSGSGGGGGGAGGAILLESSMIQLGDEATVCANGGGGGAGAGGSKVASSGSAGQCAATPALGGIGAASGGTGGANLPAGAGAPGTGASGGGGGGGAVGRIRINGPVSGNARVVTPAPTRGPAPPIESVSAPAR